MSTTQSAYRSAFTVNSSMYSSVVCDELDLYYEMIQMKIIENGCYSFLSNSNIEIHGSIHKDSFNPFDPLKHIIFSNNNTNPASNQFKIKVYLQANSSYILVVEKSYLSASGTFSITVSGPNNVTLNRISEY